MISRLYTLKSGFNCSLPTATCNGINISVWRKWFSWNYSTASIQEKDTLSKIKVAFFQSKLFRCYPSLEHPSVRKKYSSVKIWSQFGSGKIGHEFEAICTYSIPLANMKFNGKLPIIGKKTGRVTSYDKRETVSCFSVSLSVCISVRSSAYICPSKFVRLCLSAWLCLSVFLCSCLSMFVGVCVNHIYHWNWNWRETYECTPISDASFGR